MLDGSVIFKTLDVFHMLDAAAWGGSHDGDVGDAAAAKDAIATVEAVATQWAADGKGAFDPPKHRATGQETYEDIARQHGISVITLFYLNNWRFDSEAVQKGAHLKPPAGFELNIADPALTPPEWPRESTYVYATATETTERTHEVQTAARPDVKAAQADLQAFYLHMMQFGQTGPKFSGLKQKAEAANKTLTDAAPDKAETYKAAAYAAADVQYQTYVEDQLARVGTLTPGPDDAYNEAAMRMADEKLTDYERLQAAADYAYLVSNHGQKPTGSMWTSASNTINFIAAAGPVATGAVAAVRGGSGTNMQALAFTQAGFQRPEIVINRGGVQYRMFDGGDGSTIVIQGREEILPLTQRPTFIGQRGVVIPGGVGQFMAGADRAGTSAPAPSGSGGRAGTQVMLSTGAAVTVQRLTEGAFNQMPTWTVLVPGGDSEAVQVRAWSAPAAVRGAAGQMQAPLTSTQRALYDDVIADLRAEGTVGSLREADRLEAARDAGSTAPLQGVTNMAQPGTQTWRVLIGDSWVKVTATSAAAAAQQVLRLAPTQPSFKLQGPDAQRLTLDKADLARGLEDAWGGTAPTPAVVPVTPAPPAPVANIAPLTEAERAAVLARLKPSAKPLDYNPTQRGTRYIEFGIDALVYEGVLQSMTPADIALRFAAICANRKLTRQELLDLSPKLKETGRRLGNQANPLLSPYHISLLRKEAGVYTQLGSLAYEWAANGIPKPRESERVGRFNKYLSDLDQRIAEAQTAIASNDFLQIEAHYNQVQEMADAGYYNSPAGSPRYGDWQVHKAALEAAYRPYADRYSITLEGQMFMFDPARDATSTVMKDKRAQLEFYITQLQSMIVQMEQDGWGASQLCEDHRTSLSDAERRLELYDEAIPEAEAREAERDARVREVTEQRMASYSSSPEKSKYLQQRYTDRGDYRYAASSPARQHPSPPMMGLRSMKMV